MGIAIETGAKAQSFVAVFGTAKAVPCYLSGAFSAPEIRA